jgi:hypothetical protein
MMLFAHHMAVELFGREFSPQGPVQHVCVFIALALIVGTSAYGTLVLATKTMEKVTSRRRL